MEHLSLRHHASIYFFAQKKKKCVIRVDCDKSEIVAVPRNDAHVFFIVPGGHVVPAWRRARTWGAYGGGC